MKVKIIDSNLEDYNKEFKLRRMNYDQVVVNYPGNSGIKVFNKDSVEFITESEIDEFLISYSDFLKIKLNRGISVTLYKAILDTIEKEFEIEFKDLNLLRDKYIVNKRGIWEKEILCVINEIIPLKICSFEIKKISKEIKEKEEILARYGMAIEKIKKPENPVKMLV